MEMETERRGIQKKSCWNMFCLIPSGERIERLRYAQASVNKEPTCFFMYEYMNIEQCEVWRHRLQCSNVDDLLARARVC